MENGRDHFILNTVGLSGNSLQFFCVYLSFLFIGKDLNPEVIPAYIVMSIPFIEDKTWGNLKYQSQGEIELKSTQFLKIGLGAVRWGL